MQDLNVQLPLFQVGAVDVGDLEFPALGGTQIGGHVAYLVIVEVQPSHGILGLRFSRFFFDADGRA